MPRKQAAASAGRHRTAPAVRPAKDGAWPIPEVPPDPAAIEEIVTAAHLDEGPVLLPEETADDLTPQTLLGDHRAGH